MSSDSQDSEGEDLCTLRPSLIQELRNILDLYPDDGQILKELIQNAEDAGATTVKVLTDNRRFNRDIDSRTLRKHPHLKFFKGPALCVYNDAEFSESDWKGIRMLHTSIKEKDPLKVGRFGLGFKSVFHLTDGLVILSGDYIMYMDPFKGEDRYCNWRRVAGRKGKELQSILHSLGGSFGVTEQTFQAGSGRFPGTLFWFPLRLCASELSSTLYAEENLDSLLASFRMEAPSMLLFLNHVQRVQILARDDTHCLQERFSVGIAADCQRLIQGERDRFVRDVSSAGAGLPENQTFCITEVTMETSDTCGKTSTRWLVVNYHSGRRQMSPALLRLCTDGALCYRPCVGVAVPLTKLDSFQSQLFCFLPLPLDTHSPTGLPMHVHGYFALEQNRRHLKWPPADQLRHTATSHDPASQWNCLLVTELLPLAYSQALLRLLELCPRDPATFYQAWPDVSRVQDRWKPLLHPLYSSLTQQAVFFSQNLGGQWVLLRQAVLQLFSAQFTQAVRESVVKVYTANRLLLVQLPQHVYNTVKQLGFLRGVSAIKATQVGPLIPPCLSQLQRQDKLNLLHFLSQHGADLVLGQSLLPLADGVSFGVFRSAGPGQSSRFLAPRQLIELFPGLEVWFCDDGVPAHVKEDLLRLAKSGSLSLEELRSSDSRIPALLRESLQVRFELEAPVLKASDPWIQRVWHFLASVGDLTKFSHISLLPSPLDGNRVSLLPLKGRYVSSSASGMSPLSSALASALSKLGVTVLHDLPSFVTGHSGVMGHFIHYPSPQGILQAVQCVNDDSSLQKQAIKEFNSTGTAEEKAALLQFVSSLGGSGHTLRSLFIQLKLFKTAFTNQFVSLCQASTIGPDSLPPILPPVSLLSCSAASEKQTALCFGAREVSLPQITAMILDEMCSSANRYSERDVVQFMKYFLQTKVLMSHPVQVHKSGSIPFVRTECGTLQLPANLYDPSSRLLQELFLSQRQTKFPSGEFADPQMLKKLKKLGLCTESEVKPDDLIAAANAVSDLWRKQDTTSAMKNAEALFLYLNTYSEKISSETLKTIYTIQCLPCLQDGDKPAHYPKSLAIRACPQLVRPVDMYSYALLEVIGSVAPVCRPSFSPKLEGFCVCQQATLTDVLKHLKTVTTQFQQQEISQYKMILNAIFHHLARNRYDPCVLRFLQSEKCILRETGEVFSQPKDFWMQRQDSDIDLRLYRFPLPVEMQQMEALLEQCGCSKSQTDEMLKTVLVEIQLKHMNSCISQPQCDMDIQLVQQILEVLKKSQDVKDGNTLLPIVHDQTSVLRFKPAKECTVIPGMGHFSPLLDADFEIHVVHPDIPAKTALDLGAYLMKKRALTGLEVYEQDEELTIRLHGLLQESYTDGFSVPKELIQNADDAGASKVSFLLDERENMQSRTNLIADAMSSLQGPAIWAYNDAMFSPSDFQNIIRLGAGTKKEDTSKVGRFGLGFSAVYNLTDVPCFISGHILAMFDPQKKYLGKGAGLKLDFTKPINRALLSRMPEQFQPFQNIFGCILKGLDVYYKGTLFRFPLRTEDQAVHNKLKSESYSDSKRRDFLKMLLEKAGSLLLFTQNVKEIEVFYLSSHCTDMTNMTCLLSVQKSCSATVVCQPQVSMNNQTILQFMKNNWLQQRDIKIQQQFNIEITVTAEANSVCGVKNTHSSTRWQVAWASGTGESASLALEREREGLVPLAAAAISVSDDGLIPLSDNPCGFYNTGHLFCFLPLPENLELSESILPIHVNGTFALTSSRRSLLVQTEDDLKSRGSSWNTALYTDAICHAYLLLLQQVREEAAADKDFSRFFNLWPRAGVPCLMNSFYRHLQTDGNPVLPVPGHRSWVSFNDARFLQPHFRDSDCGWIAWKALQTLWTGPGYLVDVPSDICELMKDNCSSGEFKKKVITELAFYRDVFFPNLHSEWWKPEERDILIHYAVMKNSKEINQLIRDNACIPCQGGKVLRKPEELVSPKGLVAKLFLIWEQRFPQTAKRKSAETVGRELLESKVDFCCDRTLRHLSGLGMKTDVLPWDMVLDRARSVERLKADGKVEESVGRASYLVEYLSTSTDGSNSLEHCPDDIRQSLSQTAFLPVLRRPDSWPFPWAGDQAADTFLAPPADLCLEAMKNLVSSNRKLLDVKALNPRGKVLDSQTRTVLRLLGVVSEDYSNRNLFGCVLDHLITVATQHSTCSCDTKLIQAVSREIYAYLDTCLRKDKYTTVSSVVNPQGNEEDFYKILHAKLIDKCIIWTGSTFVQPCTVAFQCNYSCAPYLLQLGAANQTHKHFFKAAGVKDRFTSNDVLQALEKLTQENRGMKLESDTIDLVSRIAQLLASIVQYPGEQLDADRVFLPDFDGFMQQTCSLCVDDCAWLKETNNLKFVHEKISKETARLLGVKTKQRQHLSLISRPISYKPFGQSEKLTTRIRRLLQGYTLDSSVWKELLQNADDAKATEAMFIMDFRELPKERVPEKWESLQGPALCFYNNKSFTSQDMEGIQNLGVGSKGQDDLKIGQFGVGFTAVFHITDIPSFWTKVDDTQDVICVLDPNYQYVSDEDSKPGIQLPDVQEVRRAYPDFFSGYLDGIIDQTQPGTLFRFPLRSEKMAEASEIKKEVVTQSDIRELLEKFKEEISLCLLFLKSLKTVGIYHVCDDGSLNKDFEVKRTLDDRNSQQLEDFNMSLQQASLMMKESLASVKNIHVLEATVRSTIDSGGDSVDWLTVHRVGFSGGVCLSEELEQEWGKENFRMLPQGGVAVKLQTEKQKIRAGNSPAYQAFCMLPLPVNTGLPVHVNGQFALDHETRRNLWNSGTGKDRDVRSEWNNALSCEIIVPAYITALKQLKALLFPPASAQSFNEEMMASSLKQYHDLFPQPHGDLFWMKMVRHFYTVIAEEEVPLFPMVQEETQQVEWLPAVRNNGFPGFFSTTDAMNCDQAQPEHHKPVILTGGISASSVKTSETGSRNTAKEVQNLLKRLNMKILEAPLHIYESFRASGVQQVQMVTADSALQFLRSSASQVKTGCNIHSLPRPVADTPLGSASNVHKIVWFVSQSVNFLSQLDGLPLCLRQSDTLHMFSASARASAPIISKYYYLLPGSAEEFVHSCLIGFFTDLNKTKGVLQTLDISMFASRLHHSLTEPCLRAGKPCAFEFDRLPPVSRDKSWLREVWKFLEKELCKQIQHKGNKEDSASASPGYVTWIRFDKKDVRNKAEEVLHCLREWCLIPVKQTQGTQSKEMLYPVKDLHKVVHLSSTPDETNTCLWKVLKGLPLSFLSTVHLPASNCLNNLVASIGHPRALLHALVSANVLTATHQTGYEILEYFSKTLEILKESSANLMQLKKELRSLPVFPAVGENLVSLSESSAVLCVSGSIPEIGLQQWSSDGHIFQYILRTQYVPGVLLEFLDFTRVTDDDFYAHYLLPSLHTLPQEAILHHITFLRDKISESMPKEHQDLIQQLKRTAFISRHGTLHRAEEFVSPHESVFRTMCSEDQFPPQPYCEPEWEQFMTVAGMVSKITPAMFLGFVRDVKNQGSRQGITDDVRTKSRTLIQHLFHSNHLRESSVLSELRDIRFLVPTDWRSIPQHQQLKEIATPFYPARLVSFSECAFKHHLHLVWSSSWILAPDADPRKYIHDRSLSDVLRLLGLCKDPPQQKVIQHLKNVAQSLSGEQGHEVFRSLQQSGHLLRDIMDDIYNYLEGNISNRDIPLLAEVPLICDIDEMQMLKPANVVIDQPKHIVRGHVEKSPVLFGRYFELFKRLGASQSVTADHYAHFLAWLKTQSRDLSLHVEELKLVKNALKGLFCCLKELPQEQRRITVDALYLPTESKTLQKSTKIVYKDGAFGSRFQGTPQNMQFFLGFKELEMNVTTPFEEIRLLPRQHQMKRLSQIVIEVIPDAIRRSASEGVRSRELIAKLEHLCTLYAIVRLVYHECQKFERIFTAESAQEVMEKLSNVYVKEISGLKTVLTLNEQEVPNCESSDKVFFIDKTEGTPRQAIVFIDFEKMDRHHRPDYSLRILADAVNYVLRTKLEKILLIDILQTPWDAKDILDKANIDECDFSAPTVQSVFPRPGRFVPVHEHCYLDNSFYHFRPGEHVGYELYDSAIDTTDESFPDTTYIFAVVIEEVSGEQDISLLARRYRIDLGRERGEVVVSATRLYKFIRKETENLNAESACTDVVQYRGQASARENQSAPDLKTVLREIREILREAWQQLSDEKDRKRVVKRLCLKWHPDKNRGNEKFCTEVTQKIFHYVDLLDNGRALPSDDEDEEGQRDQSSGRTSSAFNSSFYANMNARARMDREYYESGPRFRSGQSSSSSSSRGGQEHHFSSSGHSPRNPQPGEARRWFRQAKADLAAAQAARGLCDRAHNWICYQCHQAVEKAMKAVMYFRDADKTYMLSHALSQLALIIGDSEITLMVQQLESHLGPHIRMRYPDVQVYPRIPADVYTEEDATWACDVASKVLQRVGSLIKV